MRSFFFLQQNFLLLCCVLLRSGSSVSTTSAETAATSTSNWKYLPSGSEVALSHLGSGSIDDSVPVDAGHVFNVMSEGAIGDGRTNDAQAFKRAWKKACKTSDAIVLVPSGFKFLLQASTFAGPCSANLTFQVEGTIVAVGGPALWHSSKKVWLEFKNLQDFSVLGSGVIHGRGRRWWAQVCRAKSSNCLPGSEEPPNALVFQNCTNIRVSDIRIKDSQKFHLTFADCNGVQATGLHITAPGNSPNTDGIHIKASQNVFVLDCKIQTGDDCVSIQSGSSRILIQDTRCGPGHGISIGSLGKGETTACVWGLVVNRVTFDHTTNGFRIKTWQGGSGHAHGMKFTNSKMNGVGKPVSIDQFYCDAALPCANQTSGVAISEIIFANITGSSATNVVVDIKCSDNVPCRNIVLQNINVNPETDDGQSHAQFSCRNAFGFTSGIEEPMSCALHLNPAEDKLYTKKSAPHHFEVCT